ncbi:MAG: hypothetical protein GC204_13445 [Chloroflexi bacterium]|nr:hypothetical protein [Chloroflexota bacterium]
MRRTTLILILVCLVTGCTFDMSAFRATLPTPQGTRDQVSSPSGRYSAALWYCCDFYRYVETFEITDHVTGGTHRQDIRQAAGLSPYDSGSNYHWTPNEHYFWVITDIASSSHGCDQLLVYTGDGSRLVFDSAITIANPCRGILADQGVAILAFCPNDDIIFAQSSTFRLTPSTGTLVPQANSAATC